MARALLAGWYGNGNVGDEAILEGIVAALRALNAECFISALSAAPRDTGAKGINAARRSLGVPRSQPLMQYAHALTHRVYVLGGGGLLKDIGPTHSNVAAWLRPLGLSQLLGRRTMTYAVGVENIRHRRSAALIEAVLSRCDVVTVRDGGSARRLRDLGVDANVVVTSDPAVLLGPQSLPVIEPSVPVQVCVTMRRWHTTDLRVEQPRLVDAVHQEVAEALDELIARVGARITFLPYRLHPVDDDRAVCEDVKQRMRLGGQAGIEPMPSPTDAIDRYLKSHFVIGMRLHSIVLAAAAGTPFSAIGYMPKVGDFLEHAQTSRRPIALDDAKQPGAIKRRILADFDERQQVRRELCRSIPILRRLAELNAEMLVSLIRRDDCRLRRSISEAEQIAMHASTVRSLQPEQAPFDSPEGLI